MIACALIGTTAIAGELDPCQEEVEAQIRIDPGHPWRPPFRLEKIGQSPTVTVEVLASRRPVREFWLSCRADGREIERRQLRLLRVVGQAAPSHTLQLESFPDEIVLMARCAVEGNATELTRHRLAYPELEAGVEAVPPGLVNPVDLGTILLPAGWLLIKAGQQALVRTAVVSHSTRFSRATIVAGYASQANRERVSLQLPLHQRMEVESRLPPPPRNTIQDHVIARIEDEQGKEIWKEEIPVMIVHDPPSWPLFGAAETLLRYDAPISVRDSVTGRLSSMDYEGAWDSHLRDVVVCLPNGSRFVFWRGSSYVPFWAGRHNTALCYEWAETRPPPEGFQDAVEPLMDKELRYGRVEIVESTPARIHVRWSYQACDFNYKVFGDSAVEDFFFYPDGFGTRVLQLSSKPKAEYELSEFIILTPQGRYPFEIFPETPIRALFMDGYTRELSYPVIGPTEGNFVVHQPGDIRSGWPLGDRSAMPAVYRVQFHRDDLSTAIYFNPNPDHPKIVFAPFYDQGYLVTPAYWGSHWPLARGMTTGSAIEDRISFSPAHNSLMTFGINQPISPRPIRVSEGESFDTLGRSVRTIRREWAWFIGISDEPDMRLLARARSFAQPPALDLKGARMDVEPYVSQRRALGLVVEDSHVDIRLRPTVECVNPVFEFRSVPGKLLGLRLNGSPAPQEKFSWDGRTLWLNAHFSDPITISLLFDESE